MRIPLQEHVTWMNVIKKKKKLRYHLAKHFVLVKQHFYRYLGVTPCNFNKKAGISFLQEYFTSDHSALECVHAMLVFQTRFIWLVALYTSQLWYLG